MTNKLSTTNILKTMPTVELGNLEQLLTYYNVNDTLKCNLNAGVVIQAPESAYEEFHLKTSMFWPQISYLIYGTSSLYWLLQQLNPSLTATCFGKVEAPNHVKYLPTALEVIAAQQINT